MEESLISAEGADATAAAEQQQTEQVQQEIAQEAGPAIERPEWLLDRYAMKNDTEERDVSEAISEQAKGYNELRKQLGGFTGAPEEYDFKLPEGVEGEIDNDLEAMVQFKEIAKGANMSNDTAQQLFEVFVGYQNSMMGQVDVDRQQQKQLLGDNADQRLASISGWAQNNLPAEDMEAFAGMLVTSQQVEAMERIIGKTRGTQMHKTGESSSIPSFTESDFRKAVESDRYQSDPGYRAEIRKKAQSILPS